MNKNQSGTWFTALAAWLPLAAFSLEISEAESLFILFLTVGLSVASVLFFDIARPLFFPRAIALLKTFWIASGAIIISLTAAIPVFWALSVYALVFFPGEFLSERDREEVSYKNRILGNLKRVFFCCLVFGLIHVCFIYARGTVISYLHKNIFSHPFAIFLFLAVFAVLNQSRAGRADK